MNTKILDCTLRDGGYYCSWDFDDSMVRRYLAAMEASGIDMVELGFRANTIDGFAGKYAFCRDEMLRELTAEYSFEIAVMIDGKNFIEGSQVDQGALSALFAPSVESPIDLIRITSTVTTAEPVAEMADVLHALGYAVSVNIMRTSMLSEEEIALVGRFLADSKASVAYLADSFGGLLPHETARKVASLKDAFGRQVGFHPHDNLGLALANSLAAMDSGADVVDSSVLGMGRGAGNLRTEQLLHCFVVALLDQGLKLGASCAKPGTANQVRHQCDIFTIGHVELHICSQLDLWDSVSSGGNKTVGDRVGIS